MPRTAGAPAGTAGDSPVAFGATCSKGVAKAVPLIAVAAVARPMTARRRDLGIARIS